MNPGVERITKIFEGDLAGVERLLENNPDLDVDNVFMINNAVNNGEEDAENNGEEEVENTYTALGAAIIKDDRAIIEILFAHGASVNGPVGVFVTPLQLACQSGSLDIVSLLLEHGADVDATTVETRTPLTLACESDENLDIVELLLNAGADENGGDKRIVPIREAARSGNTEAVELLIAEMNSSYVADLFLVPPPGWSSPLHCAACRNQLNCVTTLLAARAYPNSTDAEGQNPLHDAAWNLSVDVVLPLLYAGCSPLHRDNNGRTPLQYLYEKRNEELVSVEDYKIIITLVAAGDHSWQCVPTPCPGLEAAMLCVWTDAPDELPELVKRTHNPPENLTELFPRMDEEMQKVVQEVLRVLHHHFSGFPQVKEQVLKSIFGLATSV